MIDCGSQKKEEGDIQKLEVRSVRGRNDIIQNNGENL